MAWENGSPAFRSFLAANPTLAGRPRGEQLGALRDLGRAEWSNMIAATVGMTFGGVELPDADFEAPDPAVIDARTGYRLPRDNPLPIMRRFLAAYRAMRAQDYGVALGLAETTRAEAVSLWGQTNAGLVLADVTIAESHLQQGRHQAAKNAAERGLVVIAAHPERALPLSFHRARLLRIRAETALALAAPAGPLSDPGNPPERLREEARGAREEAAREQRRRALPASSPFFNVFALIPGLQPAGEWNEQRGEIALPLVASFQDALTIAAGIVPSVDAPPTRSWNVGDPIATAGEAGHCLVAVTNAASVGDFRAVAAANGRLIGLLSERNIIQVVRRYAADEDEEMSHAIQEAWEDATGALASNSDEEEANIGPLFALGGAYVQGQMPELVARFEASVTPRALAAIVQVATRDAEGENRARTLRIMNRYREDLGRAVVYLRTALAMLFREPQPSDARTMRAASDWLAGPGAARVRAFVREFEAPREPGASASFLDGRSGQILLRWLPAVFDSFGWASAHARGDDRATRAFEGRIFGVFRAHLRAEDPARLASLEPALAQLERGAGSPGDRSLRAIPRVFSAAAATLASPGPARAVVNAAVGRVGDADHSEEPIVSELVVQGYASALMIPLAGQEERWEDIVSLGSPVVNRLTQLIGEADLDAINLFGLQEIPAHPAFEIMGRPVGYYIYALHHTGRGNEAVALLDRALPALRRVETNGREDEKTAVATLLPDFVLQTAVIAYAGVGRLGDATLIARVRARKAQLMIGIPNGWGRPDAIGGLRLERTQAIGDSAFEYLLGLASRSPEGPQKWNDVLTAIDGGKRSAAADALMLHAMATAAGQGALAAYDRYLALVARRESHSGLEGLALRNNSDNDALSTQILAARADLVAQISRALPDASSLSVAQTDMTALRQALRPGELAIATMVVGDRIALFTVGRDQAPSLTMSPVGYGQVTDALVAVGRAFELPGTYTSARDLPRPDEEQLQLLYSALIAPIDAQVRAAGHIIWSPDTALAEVPIAALYAPTPIAVSGEAPTRYLGLARSITVAPSLRGLVLQRRSATAAASGGSFAIGDLRFRDAPGLPRLRDTTDARQTIAQFTRLTGGRASTGGDATFGALQSLGARPLNLLMVYTHGLGNSDIRGPGLYFMPEPTRGPLARPADIMSLGIRPRWVLLAACSTGDTDGSGTAPYGGIVRSFLVLGSRGVLAAQRRVDEGATARLMIALVEEMTQRRRGPAEALRLAQRRVAPADDDNPVLWAQLLWVGDASGE